MAMAGSSMNLYAWPCTVNVANFVSVKPWVNGVESSRCDFRNWREQMLCLLESQEVVGFVDGEIQQPPEEAETEEEKKAWRRTDRLVKGWILGSIGNDALNTVSNKETARDVWLELHAIFKDNEASDNDNHGSQEEQQAAEEIEKEESDNNGQFPSSGDCSSSRYLTVYKAAQRGEWDTIKNLFPDINELSSSIISSYSETPLHVAVVTGKANNLVNKLLEIMPLAALTHKNHLGNTALQNAAIVGNTAAASALVKTLPDLLLIPGFCNLLPVVQAALYGHKKTLEYLISEHEAKTSLFEGQLGVELLNEVIASEFTDIALYLVRKYPNLALPRDGLSPLTTIATKSNLFPSTETFSLVANVHLQSYSFKEVYIRS